MMNAQHSYADFRDVSEVLNGVLRRSASIWDELGSHATREEGPARGDKLRSAADHLLAESFNLMIVGEFKRGKSTLINAMLGKQLLPAKVAPCTAVITQVHYGEREFARLYYQDPQQPPTEVPAADLRKYVVIDDGTEHGLARSARYSRMEVHAPLALCRNGVTLTDSPGLNEHETRTDVSLRFLTEADALLLVLSCEQALSSSELSFVTETLARSGHDLRNVFVVWNRYEAVRDSEEDDRDIRERSRKYLEPVVGGASRVFYVSALEALKGRHGDNPELVQRSGLPTFERALEAFLTSERGALKIRNPLGVADGALRELGPAIERRRILLHADVAPLQQRYDAARPKLEKLTKDREKIRRRIERARDDLASQLVSSYRGFRAGLRQRLEAALEKEVVGIPSLLFNKKEAGARLQAVLSAAFQQLTDEWSRSEVTPAVDRMMGGLEDYLHEGVAEYVRELEGLRDSIVGGVPAVGTPETDEGVFERVLAAAGGFALGGVGGAVMGGSMGFKRMLGGMGVHLTLVIGALVLGLNPIGAIVLSILSGLGLTAVQGDSMAREFKRHLVTNFCEGVEKASDEVEARLRGDVDSRLNDLRDKVDGELALMLEEVRGQVESALHDLTERREEVDRRASRLLAMAAGLDELNAQLDQVRAYVGR